MRAAGPRVVAIGGGRGLATALRAARRYAGELTAVVSVADDGGSSGALTAAYGLAAPGDLRKCLTALSPESRIVSDLFDFRFGAGPLAGHSLGNLIITGLAEICGGILPAVEVAASILGCEGRVLPVCTEPLALEATLRNGERVAGQAKISASASEIVSVSLRPRDAKPAPGVLEAIEAADQVVIGPGSLFTSVIPPLLVEGMREALEGSRAVRVYVCNLVGQRSETLGMSAADHYRALLSHGLTCDVLVFHPWGREAPEGAVFEGDLAGLEVDARPCYIADSADPTRHDPRALATALSELLR